MNEHPYWLTLTIAVGLIAASAVAFLGCLAGWAWTRWKHASLQVKWAIDAHATPDEEFEAEHRQLLADHRDEP